MFVSQIAVFLENKQGKLDSLIKAISAANINMLSLNIADTNEFGIIRIITSDNNKALEVIKNAGFTAKLTDILAVEVDNVPGTLANVLDTLSNNNISIEYLYSYTENSSKNLILMKTSDLELSEKLLNK